MTSKKPGPEETAVERGSAGGGTSPPRPPLVVVLAGPNGAGKSTASARLLRGALTVEEFVNADVIAQGLSAYRPEDVAFQAGRVMLQRLRYLAAHGRDFAFETTLSGRGHARWLRSLGTRYRRHLTFLALPDVELAIARVADRVRQGGHHIPDDVVWRRYHSGIRNFFGPYQEVVDTWQVVDNSEVSGPRLVAMRAEGEEVEVFDEIVWASMKAVLP